MSTHPFTESAHRLKTKMGGCFPGEKAIFRGQDLHKDLGDIEWFDLYVYGVIGRRLDKNQLLLLQTLWTYTSYPDARIWNNRVAALAGSARSSSNLAMAASTAVSEAGVYGSGVSLKSINFFIRSQESIKKGANLEDLIKAELKTNRGIGGYGRPLVSSDERIIPIMKKAKSLSLADGHYVRLAYQVDDFLSKGRWRLKMNYGGLSAAFAADIGLSAVEYYKFLFPVFLAGMQSCYTEAEQKRAGSLFPTACAEVAYKGVEKRSWNNR